MANQSPVTIAGNLTNDPELRSVGSGNAQKLTFSVAVNHSFKNRNDEWDETTSFFNVVAWRQLAESAAFLQKGVRVIVTGRLEQRSWEADDGAKRSTIEVLADDIAVSCKAITGYTRKTREGGDRPRPGTAQKKQAPSIPADEEPF